MIKKTIAIYAGRFQPFGPHHKKAYEWLCGKFGKSNVYIATSNSTDSEKSPFTFDEKVKIIKSFGVTNVISVKNPYSPQEVLKKFDSNTTAVVFGIGEKDETRIGSKYYKEYTDSKNILPFKDTYYYIIVPNQVATAAGSSAELSGTAIRKILSDPSIKTKKQMMSRFKDVFGFFDKGVYDLIVKKMQPGKSRLFENTETISEWLASEILMEQLLTDFNPVLPSLNQFILNCGGAYGHLSHVYEDIDLTFGEIKEMINLGLSGELNLKEMSEKIDGQNIMASVIGGKTKFARNGTDIKTGGMDKSAVISKFAGRGVILDAFNSAFDDLDSALTSLSKKDIDSIFGNNTWANIEIVYPATTNCIDYDGSFLVLNGLVTYDSNGNAIGDSSSSIQRLYTLIQSVNKTIGSRYTIKPPILAQIQTSKKFDTLAPKFTGELSKIQSKYNLSDTDTIGTYHTKWCEELIKKNSVKFKYAIPPDVLTGLMNRWGLGIKQFALTNTNISNEGFLKWAKDFDKNNQKETYEKNLYPIKKLILKFSVEVLKNLTGILSLDPNKASAKLKSDFEKTMNIMSSSDNLDAKKLGDFAAQLKVFNDLGGMKSVVPTEGIVFRYGGKVYKLTGSFAPLNRMLSVLKY